MPRKNYNKKYLKNKFNKDKKSTRKKSMDIVFRLPVDLS